jgi:hypothetical protein
VEVLDAALAQSAEVVQRFVPATPTDAALRCDPDTAPGAAAGALEADARARAAVAVDEEEDDDDDEDEDESNEEESEEDEDGQRAEALRRLMAMGVGTGASCFWDELLLEADDNAAARSLQRNPLLTSLHSLSLVAPRFPTNATYLDPTAAATDAAGAAGAGGWAVSAEEVVRLARRAGVVAVDVPSVQPALARCLKAWLQATLAAALAFAQAGLGGEGPLGLAACVAMALDHQQPLACGPAEDFAVPHGVAPDEPIHLRPLTATQVAVERALVDVGEEGWVESVVLVGDTDESDVPAAVSRDARWPEEVPEDVEATKAHKG